MLEKYKPFLIAVAVISIWISIWVSFMLPINMGMQGVDFFSYYLGAHMVRDKEGGKIYKIENQISLKNKLLEIETDQILPYKAPVSSTYIYLPLTFLNSAQAYKLFFLLQVIVLSVCCYLISKIFHTNTLPTILFSISPPIIGGLLQGQQSIILTLFAVISILFFNKQKYFLSGVLISLLLLKPQFTPIIIFLLIAVKNKRFICGLIASSLSIFLSNIFIYGKGFVKDYLIFLAKTEIPRYGSHRGISYTLKIILELIDPYLKIETTKFLLPVTAVFIISIVIILTLKRKEINIKYEEKLGLSILLGIPLGMHVNMYDLSLLIIPLLILHNYIGPELSIWWKFVFFLIFTIFTVFNFVTIPALTLLALILIIAITFLYIKKIRVFKA